MRICQLISGATYPATMSEQWTTWDGREESTMRPCVVYALMQGDAIVYIGETTNLARRVNQHRSSKVFDSVSTLYRGDENSCFEQEALHLLDFHEAYGRFPLYNGGDNPYRAKRLRNRITRIRQGDSLRPRVRNRMKRAVSSSQLPLLSL